MLFSFERAGLAEIGEAGTTHLQGVFNPVTVNRQWVVPMRIIARSILFATGLLFAAVTANAQGYYSGYYYPGYTAYPSYTYPYPYYYNYVYPSYAGSYYYSRPTAYNDPYVALRPYSDGAGCKAN
jgi:hypothetical protein